MKSCADKFMCLLESKCDLFKKMQTLFLEQKELLEKNDIAGFNSRCDEGDKIVAALKDIDYEIARLESTAGLTETAKENHDAGRLKNLLDKATGYARKNETVARELAARLTGAHQEIREKLEGTVLMSQVGGYRPFSANSPIYVDKRN